MMYSFGIITKHRRIWLIEAETGNHIWAERYDRELEHIFDLQDEITGTIMTHDDVQSMFSN